MQELHTDSFLQSYTYNKDLVKTDIRQALCLLSADINGVGGLMTLGIPLLCAGVLPSNVNVLYKAAHHE